MNLYQALNSAKEGNFVTHETFDSDESLHFYNGKYYYEDGAVVPAFFLKSQDWAENGWNIKFTADRINREKLREIHETSRGYMLSEGSYENCLNDKDTEYTR